LLVGALTAIALLAIPAAALGDESWPPTEGPAWWITHNGEQDAHSWIDGEGVGARIEPTALTATSATFVGHIKPIAGASVTYWEMDISANPECRGIQNPETGREVYEQCLTPNTQEQELYAIGGYHFASGEIVGGNPEDDIEVTGSTLNGGNDAEEEWDHEAHGAELGPPKPFALLPGRVYRAFISTTTLQNTWQENWRLKVEPWLEAFSEVIDIFTPGTPVSNAQLKREERKKAKQEQHERRRKEREEHKHGR